MTIRAQPIPWNQLQEIVKSNELDFLGRSKEQETIYYAFKHNLKAKQYDLVTNLLIHSLQWVPNDLDPRTDSQEAMKLIAYKDERPFADAEDVKIIWNDFPYYYAEPVAHVCVWVKFPMPEDPNSSIGDIDTQMKYTIERYIWGTFCDKLGIDRNDLVWWKNYTALQSIRVLPHVHVAVRLNKDKLKERISDELIGKEGVLLQYPQGKL